MTQYISKSALVAETKGRIAEGEKVVKEFPSSAIMGLIQAYKNVLSFLDTLEVKEVDLEKELDSMITPELKFHKALPSLYDVAKHFFELGLKAQKGE